MHIWVPSSASRLPAGALVHCAVPPIPLARTICDEPLINILFHVARCLPRADALIVWESALASGRTDATVLRSVNWRSTRAAELADVASHLSASGIETQFSTLMRSVGVVIRQQVWIDGHPLDAVIGDFLLIQLDGFAHHSNAADRRRDLRADARLVLRGYTILRFDYQQVFFDAAYVVDAVLTAIAQRRHTTPRR